MLYTVKNTELATEVDLKGRLTFSDYVSFREITDLFGERPNQSCAFNLAELEFIDSAGLGMLLIARDKLKSIDGTLILKGAQGQVKQMLDLSRFNTLFIVE